ncbi:MAG TPA: SET domain-containing protein-lysine N-methyltransferase [Blastocatellia bacterium]|nr:SET domain-containing protein-lysine N-methyltransferase [Blastocatellia bacterium]
MSAWHKLVRHQDHEETRQSDLSIRKSNIHGRGCFTNADITAGQLVAEFTGELISSEESARRRLGQRKYSLCAVDDNHVIDGSVGGNPTQYINHCCEPNCEVIIRYGRVMIYAIRDIRSNDELTVDYQSSYHSNRKLCRCGAKHCRGTINQQKGRTTSPR